MVKIIKVDDFWESMLPLLSSGGASSVFKAWFLFYFSVRLGISGGGRRRCETCTRKQLIIWTRIPFIIVKHTWAPPPPLESWLLGLVPVSCRRNMGTSTIFIKNKRKGSRFWKPGGGGGGLFPPSPLCPLFVALPAPLSSPPAPPKDIMLLGGLTSVERACIKCRGQLCKMVAKKVHSWKKVWKQEKVIKENIEKYLKYQSILWKNIYQRQYFSKRKKLVNLKKIIFKVKLGVIPYRKKAKLVLHINKFI